MLCSRSESVFLLTGIREVQIVWLSGRNNTFTTAVPL